MNNFLEKDAWLRFEAMERAIEVETWQISGVFAWKLVRHRIYEMYLSRIGLAGALSHQNPSFTDTFRKAARFLFHAIFANPYIKFRPTGRPLFISSEREKQLGNRVVDTIADRDYLRAHLSKTHVLFTSRGNLKNIKSGQSANSLPIALGRLLALFQWSSLSYADSLKLRIVARDLLEFGRDRQQAEVISKSIKVHSIFIGKLMKRETAIFKGTRLAYRLLFWMAKPDCLYLVTSYTREAAISAAKSMGIKVYEFQHGSSGQTHYGYDFKLWKHVPYFPDVFLAWGQDWIDETVFPKECQVQIVGPTSNQQEIKQLRSRHGPAKQLLIVSQGIRSVETIKLVMQFLQIRADWKATIKPHPKDGDFAYLIQIISREYRDLNLRVHSGDLLSAFSQADVVIGENSSSLVEALLAGRKVVLVRARYKIMESLPKAGHAIVVETANDLADSIDDLRIANVDGYFGEHKFIPGCKKN